MSIAKTRMTDCMSSRRPLYAPKGVKVEEREDSWVLTSDNYRRNSSYTAIRFTKAKLHELDNAMRVFLMHFGTKDQRAEFAASGRECPSDWKSADLTRKFSARKPISRAIRHLTQKQKAEIGGIVDSVFGESGIEGARFGGEADNPFAFHVTIPVDVAEWLVVDTCNTLFHRLDLLPKNKNLKMNELWDYCNIVRDSGIDGAGNESHAAFFNHPIVMSFNEGDSASRFILKNWRNWDGD